MTTRPGKLLNERWRIGSPVSSGGQGKVFTATDMRTSEKCAAKVFQVKGFQQQRLARAKIEIEAIKKLTGSANVVQIRDENISSAVAGAPTELFYIMDYARHGSLADNDFYIGDVEQCLRMFKEILIGVREAHRKGVIHRDLKPANILLHPTQREVVITDFGLGLIKEREADEGVTQSDELLGPRFFMAPEQYLNPSEADERSDIYSLGKILYYMLTGKGKVFREQVGDINKDLKTPNPYLPQVQELLLNRMVAEKPGDRFINVEEAIDEVDRIIAQIEINVQRYLKPIAPSDDIYASLTGSRRDILVSWFKENIVFALQALENAVLALRRDAKTRTYESLKDELLRCYPRGKVNDAIKSALAYTTDPQGLATLEGTSRYSFASYYMARYFAQSLAFSSAHAYIAKALDIESDAALQLHYLLVFEEICRKCSCALPHDYDRRVLRLLRSADGAKKADLLKVLGKHCLQIDQKSRGLRFLEAYLDAKPYDHSIRFDCAYGYHDLGEYALAIHHYSILTTHGTEYSDQARVINNLGAAYDALGLVGMSLAKYREANNLGFTVSGSNVANRYINVGMLDEAKELLDEIIVTYPKTYHENVAIMLGRIASTRKEEKAKLDERKATGAMLSHEHIQAVKSLLGDDNFSWAGRWKIGEAEFECSEVQGSLSAGVPAGTGGEFRCVVDGKCLYVTSFKKRFEAVGKTGLLYLTSEDSFAGYLASNDAKYTQVRGTRA